jgi:glutamyl-tRNA reductase
MRVVAAGLSYRTAPVAVRERAALGDLGSGQLLRYLVGHSGLSGALALSTCHRIELYVSCPTDGPVEEIVPRLTRYLDPSGKAGVASAVRTYEDEDAIAHLFRVAAGLESMVVGEAQVLGQVRAAHRVAVEAGTLDAHLDVIARRAISTGKRVRHETALGRAKGGLGQAAVDLAVKRLGSVHGRHILLVGAGKVSAAAARGLQRQGAELTVVSRGESAVRLAGEVGGRVARGQDLVDLIAASEVVITSTTSDHTILAAGAVAEAQRRRGNAPLLIIDLAVPRDVEPAAGAIEGVDLVDIDGLDGLEIADPEAVAAAGAIVEAELARTHAVLAARASSAPTVRELLARAETLRRREVERTVARLPEDDEVRERIERMSRSLVAKLLDAPVRHLREVAHDPQAVLRVRDAFDLDAESDDPVR